MRASNTKSFLEFVEERRPGTVAHLRATLAPKVVDAIFESGPADWLDVDEIHGVFLAELVRWLGNEPCVDAYRRYVGHRLIGRPAYRALLEGTIRLFGLTLGGVVKRFTPAFLQGFRDCADAHVEVADHEATVELKLTPAFSRHPEYAPLLHGMFLGMVAVARAKAEVDFEADFAAQRVVVRLRW